jgi:hypothetical protein
MEFNEIEKITKNDKSDTEKDEIKEKFYEWCEYCTTHGIPNLARNKSKLIRAVWICAILACGSYCFYSIVVSIMSYLAYAVLINIKVTESTPIDFPAVTVIIAINLAAANPIAIVKPGQPWDDFVPTSFTC